MTAKRIAPKKSEPDLVEEFEFEQRGDEWYAMRIGLCTASVFKTIMASGKDEAESRSRATLMNRMAAEIIFERPMETFTNAAMQRGVDMEPAALEHYAFTNGIEVRRVGFVRRTVRSPLGRDLVVGCSPDGIVGDDGLVQVKTMQPDLIVKLVDTGRFPSEHRAQCHGELWVTGRKWVDLKVFFEGFPISPIYRIVRNESYIAEVRAAVETFAFELRGLVERVRAKS